MHYKKFFSATALVTLLSLSHSAFSDPIGPIDDEETSYYFRAQYNGEFLPIKTSIAGIDYKKDTEAQDPLKASFIAGSGAFGCRMDGVRVEFEGGYSQLDKNTVTDAIFTPSVADKLSVISGLVNVHYDVQIADMSVIPYVGVGVGVAYISNPAKEKIVADQKHGFGFAYQAKAGVSYPLTTGIDLVAGGRYFGAYGAKFDKKDANNAVTKDAYKVLYSTVGVEAGVAFNF
ncbi:P44/Msp2 family outer membrane protein [Wolbachia endosymbiont of Cantharis cryptica]|uniref:P44/Msp2 family outer membrane protein n=1 Tax=Wolbachia endosymbiont of Cantharis cryptica TaxID=3066132 RepID=UPI00376EC72A